MENRAHALAAGIFVLVLGIALVVGVLWLNRDERRGGVPYLIVTAKAVSGLKVEAPVRYRGVEVGKVESVGFDPADPGRILVGITVDEGTPITYGTYAQLGFQGVTGLSFVQLSDDGGPREPLTSSADAVAWLPMRSSVFDSGEDLVGAFGEVADRVNALLADENREQLVSMLARLDKAADRAAKLAEGLDPSVAALPRLLADANTAINEARGTVKRAGELAGAMSALAAKLEERSVALAQLGDNAADVGAAARAFSEDTLPRINALAEELRREARVLDRVLNTLADQPQSLVFGVPPRRPGPGEAGFDGGAR
jgi:phospholipid/cholesterol/gamma-HCH transport system substrate-binding protein